SLQILSVVTQLSSNNPRFCSLSSPSPNVKLQRDTEEFLGEVLQNENLSAGARDNRDHILRGLQQIKARFMSKVRPCFFFCPSGGDQAENYLGQDSSDDNHSGTHGPSLTSDAPFLSDYQDEGECHLSGFRIT
ncbi:hypothetical protein DBR06_SOUSAS8210157, partial [Sousa chinensis]